MKNLIVTAVIGMSLAFGACSSSKKKEEAPAPTPQQVLLPDSQALIGSWTDGSNTFTFNGNNTFSMTKSRGCTNPPCPSTTTSGTYQFRSGQIYISSPGQEDQVLTYILNQGAKTLSLTNKRSGESWNLNGN